MLADTQSSPRGLSGAEARARLERDGPNRLASRGRASLLSRVYGQFTDITVLALIFAAVVAVVLGQTEPGLTPLEQFGDATAIFIIVILNALIGLVQESRAERALAALSDSTAPTARVLRDGEEQQVDSADLVVGDVVLLEEGSRVPADARLLVANSLSANESSLTGESVPVEKQAELLLPASTDLAERKNSVYLGSFVNRGKGQAVVTATGMASSLGEIARLLDSVETPPSPLQRSLKRFGIQIVIACAALGVLVFLVTLAQGQASLRVLLLTSVSLAVAAIPEGLPAVTTIVLALGVQRMASKHALVRKLPAVETLGSADVICTDKTGTLTQNKMTVRRVASLDFDLTQAGDGINAGVLGEDLTESQRAALDGIVLAARYMPAARMKDGQGVGDPTDVALLNFHLAHCAEPAPPSQREQPFDADRKLASAVVDLESRQLFVHGAMEAVLSRATRAWSGGRAVELTDERRQQLDALQTAWSADGLRVLALAQRSLSDVAQPDEDLEADLCFLGLIGLSDPPRPAIRESIAKAARAGVRTLMITGDHPLTAKAIAREVGIGGADANTLLGSALDSMSPAEIEESAKTVDVVARATAAHKLLIVEALQRQGHVVAMTGDGVNDAPALRAAAIGVAMGQSGTDVAREAGDLVLADDNYTSIVSAIEEGRTIFANIQRFIVFLLSVNAGLVFAVLIAALLGWPPLLTPTQILWINLVTNGLPALALGAEPAHGHPMLRGPRASDSPLLTRRDTVWILGYGVFMGAVGLGAYSWLAADPAKARSLAFLVLAVGPLMHALNCRDRQRSLFSVGLSTNPQLWLAIAVGLGLQALAQFVPGLTKVFSVAPLSASELGVGAALCVTFWLAGELQKLVWRLAAGSRPPTPAPRPE